jgi:hypothetical protein
MRSRVGAASFALFALCCSVTLAAELKQPTFKYPITKSTSRGDGQFSVKPEIMRKIDPELLNLKLEYDAHLNLGKKTGKAFKPFNNMLNIKENRFIVVDITAKTDMAITTAAIKQMGCRQLSAFQHMVSAQCPIDAIERLGQENSINFVRPAMMQRHSGLVNSQGDQATRADLARTNLKLSGNGITVGVLSDSYNCNSAAITHAADDVASGDLPAGVVVLSDLAVGTANCVDEGRAMLQLIHDLAPASTLVFYTAELGEAAFANGILALRNTAHADVMVDDIIYFTEPMFQDGIVAQAVDQVVNNGVAYFSSAGNEARKSYQANYNPSGQLDQFGSPLHDFDNGPGVDVFQRISLPTGQTSPISFQWNSAFFSVSGAPGASSDYDIWLCLSDTQAVDTTNCPINGITLNVGNDAVEIIVPTIAGASGGVSTMYLAIARFSGANNNVLKYVVSNSNASIDEYDTASATDYGHPNSNGAEAVGAAAYFQTPAFGTTPPLLEAFSSAGGVPILINASGTAISPVIRQKPGIVAPDGGNTTFFIADVPQDADNFPNFFGTSAAAPHAAAVAALMLEANGGRGSASPKAMYTAMETTAININTVGFDFDSGFGLIQADAAVKNLADPDGDALLNRLEIPGCTNQLDRDSDDDGLADGREDANLNGIMELGETNPCSVDSDNDGIQDGTELGIVTPIADPDGAGPLLGTNLAVFIPDADPATTTSPINSDTDGDGFSDGVEDVNHNGKFETGEFNPLSAASKPALAKPLQIPALPQWAMLVLGLWLMRLQISGYLGRIPITTV